ncbi:MAG: protein kinase [Gemmatimonadales bacterium]|nr:protein kinase [Gemmatimonadales bacterium]
MSTDLKQELQASLGDAYRIEEELGGGGMSRVFLATETALDRKVVVKVLPQELAGGVNIERFKREIAVAARLQHAHIVPLLTAGDANGLPYFTMPYVEGESLRTKLTRGGELSVKETVQILREVTLALGYAHDQGVVHRDIKPDNILISGGSAMVADFGVAKALSSSATEGSQGRLTSLGIALGTPAYMAPEQAAADPTTDHRADIYALGAVAYEMLTGSQLFSGRSPQGMLAAHVTLEPEAVSKIRPTVPPLLADLVMSCLAKRAADRPQAADEILHTLDALATPSGGMDPTAAARTAEAAAPRFNRSMIYAAAAVAILVIVVGVLNLMRDGSGGGAAAGRTVLAVLPFENLGPAEEQYFADGLTEELTSRLSRVSGLSVIARSSAYQYRASGLTAPEFGQELGAEYVLDGSVRWAGASDGASRVRVSPALIKVSDGTEVWSEPYESVLADVFQLQSDLSERVALALEGSLRTADREALQRAATTDLDAYNLYTLGRFHWRTRLGPDLVQAAEFFQQAVERDPGFARAYTGLADTYALFPYYRVRTIPSDEAYARARDAANRALLLDSTLAEAHASLGNVVKEADWNWNEAERHYLRAIELDPDYATAHQWLAELYYVLQRFPESLVEAERAHTLDALSPVINFVLGRSLQASDRFAEAVAAAQRARELGGDTGNALFNQIDAYADAGRPDGAYALFQEWWQISPFNTGSQEGNALAAEIYRLIFAAHTDTTLRASLRQAVAQVPDLWGTSVDSISWQDRVWFYWGLGENEALAATLAEAARGGSAVIDPLFLSFGAWYERVKHNPRFVALRKESGLE